MGLLKSIIGDAVSKGIKKGLSDAVGKAVEGIVKPTVDNFAQKQADQINAAGESLEQSTAELRRATAEAGKTAPSTPIGATGSGLAGLEAALGGWAQRAESLATEMSKNMKTCPQCGEVCTADKQFCPHCGAKLPERTTADDYTCPKCGEVNVPGSKHCSKCGTVLPAAEEEEKAQATSDATALEQFKQKLPEYPAWNVGGRAFELIDGGTQNGHPSYRWDLDGSAELLKQYVAKLAEAGFSYCGGNPTADTLYKEIGGVCHCFNRTDAVDTNHISVGFYVDNSVLPSKKTTESDIPDVADIAKGLFKKFF